MSVSAIDQKYFVLKPDQQDSIPWFQKNKALLCKIGLVSLAAISLVAGVVGFRAYLHLNIAEANRIGARLSELIIFNSVFTLGLYAVPFVASAALATAVPICLLGAAWSVLDLNKPKDLEKVRKQVQAMNIESILNRYSLEEIMRYNLVDKKTFDHKYQKMILCEKQWKDVFEGLLSVDKNAMRSDPLFSKKLENARVWLNHYEVRRKALDQSIESQYAQLRQRYPEH